MRVMYALSVFDRANFVRSDIFRGYKLLMEWWFSYKYVLKYASTVLRQKSYQSNNLEDSILRKYYS